MQQILPFVDAMMGAGNLNINQAKTAVYFSVMTHSDKPKIRPLLNFDGDSGTGKNGIMKQMKPWCRAAKWINARNKTSAQLRDDMADTITVFVEEADKTKEPQQRECENWYQCRYDESGKGITYKRTPDYIEEAHDHYGYTVLHTQNLLQSIELDRRILRIKLIKNSKGSYTITEGLDAKILAEIANKVDWDSPLPQPVSNSAWDVWLPLMRIAAHLGDDEFLVYAREQIEDKTEEDDLTKVFEPKGVVFSEVADLYTASLNGGAKHIAITSVRAKIKDRGYDYTERQIVKEAKALGFPIVYPHNKAHIKVEGEQRLRDIAARAGISLDFYDDPDTLLKSLRLEHSNN